MIRNPKVTVIVLAFSNFIAVATFIHFTLTDCPKILREILAIVLAALIFGCNVFGKKIIQELQEEIPEMQENYTPDEIMDRKKVQVAYLAIVCPYTLAILINWYAPVFLISLSFSDTPKVFMDVFYAFDHLFRLWEENAVFAIPPTLVAIVIAFSPFFLTSFFQENKI